MRNKVVTIKESKATVNRLPAMPGTKLDVEGNPTIQTKICKAKDCQKRFTLNSYYVISGYKKAYIDHPDAARELCTEHYAEYNGNVYNAKYGIKPLKTNLLNLEESSAVKLPMKKKRPNPQERNLLSAFCV